ncbi:MAG: hypothetical protein BWX49_00370 [Bacteroidetes bacterium ADurb.Bin008]|jgi:hypothetical protein|nr:MAG: hypothetical protein BWX49_00370 [Bacteroidetes bacterium ADurb.Bin008]
MGFSAAELRRGIAKLRRVFFLCGSLLLGGSLRYNQRITIYGAKPQWTMSHEVSRNNKKGLDKNQDSLRTLENN